MNTNIFSSHLLRFLSVVLIFCLACLIKLAYPSFTHAASLSSVSWWNNANDCDTTHNSNHQVEYTVNSGNVSGLAACGIGDVIRNAQPQMVTTGINAQQLPEWECVELSLRFMWLAYGVQPYATDGYDLVSNYNAGGNANLVKMSNNSGAAPQPGDVISFGNGTSANHTAVVIANNVSSSGVGTITVVQQNAEYWLNGNMQYDSTTVINVGQNGPDTNTPWHIQPEFGNSAYYVNGWLHNVVGYQGGRRDVILDKNNIVQLMNRDLSKGVISLDWQTSSGASMWHGRFSSPGSLIGDPQLIVGHNGGIWAFGVGGNGYVYETHETGPGTTWSGWNAINAPGTSNGHLAVVSQPNGYLDIFIEGGNNQIYHTWQTADYTWSSGWSQLFSGDNGTLVSGLAAAENVNGAEQIFGRGGNNKIYTTYQTSEGNESSWHTSWDLVGSVNDSAGSNTSPIVTNQANGMLDVFMVGGDNKPYHEYQDSSGNWQSAFALVGSSFPTLSTTISVIPYYNGEYVAVAKGSDNKLYWTMQGTAGNNGSWGAWGNLINLPIQSDPVAIQLPSGAVDIYATDDGNLNFHDTLTTTNGWTGWLPITIHSENKWVGQTDDGANIDNVVFRKDPTTNLITFKYQSGNPQTWSSWITTSTTLTFSGNASVTQDQSGALNAFARGSDNKVYRMYQATPGDNTTWTSWAQLGGSTDTVGGNPIVTNQTNGLLDVFAQWNNQGIYHNYEMSPTTWSGWIPVYAGSMSGDPSIVQNSSGGETIFITGGSPYNMYMSSEGVPGDTTTWQSWVLVGNDGSSWFHGSPVAITQSNGLMDLYARGGNDWLYHNYQTASGWSGWMALISNISMTGDASVVDEHNGVYQVFIRKSDNSFTGMGQTSAGSNGSWSSLSLPSGTGILEPLGMYMQNDSVDVYTQWTDSGASIYKTNESSTGGWVGWGSF